MSRPFATGSRPAANGKVEGAVLIVERWILARLRNMRFFSIEALNAAIAELPSELNDRPMRRIGRSRRNLFKEIERPAPRDLPPEPFDYAEWKLWSMPSTMSTCSTACIPCRTA